MNNFIREKKIHCGSDFLVTEVFPYSQKRQEAVKGRRGKKQCVTEPKQKNLNDKRAKRYCVQLALSNFGKGDLAVHLTYAPEHVPATYEEAHAIAIVYLRRIAYRRDKQGLPPLKYILVTQIGRKKDGTSRIHHHIRMNGGWSRDEVEEMWWKVKATKKKKAVMYGWANADRLQPNDKGISNIVNYIVQDSVGKKHWTQSQNLAKPWYRTPNDKRYSKRQIEKIAKLPKDCNDFKEFWEKKYKGWELVESDQEYNDQTGWAFYLLFKKT